ncbi:MAG: lipoyl(octanoyl) transferase LipB [Candidatus Omnitrophota bacterium]
MNFFDLGTIDHQAAFLRQKALVVDVANGSPDALILCEHPKTLTFGRKFHEANLFVPEAELAGRGFLLVRADRGGDVTLHAPGQLVLYPIIDLKRACCGLKGYLRKLEQVAVDLLDDFGIVAKGDDGNRGVWIGQKKIASIGIGVSRWVTYHGMGLNISTDLSLFRVIRPCGLDVAMTSLCEELKRPVLMDEVKQKVIGHFKRVFG